MRFLGLLALTAALGGGRQDSPSKTIYTSYLGKPPPALSGAKADWLNVREVPSLESLKGRSTLVAFTSVF